MPQSNIEQKTNSLMVLYYAVCPDGAYGDKCMYRCSPHCKSQPCDKLTAHGACPHGKCNPGFKGDNCSTGINILHALLVRVHYLL